MSAKANLRLILQADDKVVAESDDPRLWQLVLARLYGKPTEQGDQPCRDDVGNVSDAPADSPPALSAQPTAAFARLIAVSPEEVAGAFRPRIELPFLTLDPHSWEAYRRQMPPRGPHAVGPAAIAGTLLALWGKAANLPDFSISDVVAVLRASGARDNFPRRTVKNCKWLQVDGAKVLVNPARISHAKCVAKAFCKSDWSEYHATVAVEHARGRRAGNTSSLRKVVR